MVSVKQSPNVMEGFFFVLPEDVHGYLPCLHVLSSSCSTEYVLEIQVSVVAQVVDELNHDHLASHFFKPWVDVRAYAVTPRHARHDKV